MFAQGFDVVVRTQRVLAKRAWLLERLTAAGRPVSLKEIRLDWGGRIEDVLAAFEALMAEGKVRRHGRGVKGDPFIFERVPEGAGDGHDGGGTAAAGEPAEVEDL